MIASELTGKLSWNLDVESVLSKVIVQFYTERKNCTSPNTAEISKNSVAARKYFIGII